MALYIGGGQIVHATHPGADGAVHMDSMYGYDPPVGASSSASSAPPRPAGRLTIRARTDPLVDDLALVERLRAGDEAAFMALVEHLQPSMLRVARMYVSTAAVAEEVVQETWLGVLRGLDRFQGRSSLRT